MKVSKKELAPVLKKHVNTIHCSNNLSLVQRKLFNALLFNAYHDLPDKSHFTIPVKQLCSMIGYDSRDYKKLKKSLMDLITTAIEWNVIETDVESVGEKWQASAIVSGAKIEKGICTYEFSSIMRSLLYHPEIYGKIDIHLMTSFKSSYALALYENCVRFQNVASTPQFSLDVFRKLMGVPPKKYQNFCDFKKRVLDIAVKEVNLYSPLIVTPQFTKVNKRVNSIKFKLQLKEGEMDKVVNENVQLLDTLKNDFCLSDTAAAELLQEYEISYIEEKIKLIKGSDAYLQGKIRALPAYLKESLKKDFKQPKGSLVVLKEARRKKELEEITKKNQAEQAYKVEKSERDKTVDNYLAKMSKMEYTRFFAQFEEDMIAEKNFYVVNRYRSQGLSNGMVRAMVNHYVFNIMAKQPKTTTES